MLTFLGCYLLAMQGRGRAGQGRAGQGRAARADTRPLDLLAIYRILGENRATIFFLIIFIIEHIKKTIIFLKKKIKKNKKIKNT